MSIFKGRFCAVYTTVCLAVLTAFPSLVSGDEGSIKACMVKVFTTSEEPDYHQPWKTNPQKKIAGSGCIISDNQILTCASLVGNQVYIEVQREGDTHKYPARVAFAAHDCDLALLSVDDPNFYSGVTPLSLGILPTQGETMRFYGYLGEGDTLNFSSGSVSKIAMMNYRHALKLWPAILTPAALDSFTNGSAVLLNDKLVGLVIKENKKEFIAPVVMINRFLEDIKDGTYDGIPELGVAYQEMDSGGLRNYFKMDPAQSGVLVRRVDYGSASWGVIQINDVITAVDGTPVANDGTIAFGGGSKIHCLAFTVVHQRGDKVPVDLVRNGSALKVDVVLNENPVLVPRAQYDSRPTYFILAGLVFTPLTGNYIAPLSLEMRYTLGLQKYWGSPQTEERKQVVVINQVLPHEINKGYHETHVVVDKINGVLINEMRDVLKAFAAPIGNYHVIEIDSHALYGSRIILDAGKAQEATNQVLAKYKIPSDRSDDLK